MSKSKACLPAGLSTKNLPIKCMLVLVVASGFFLLTACKKTSSLELLTREQLFTLRYGMFEDELNIFNLPGNAPPLKTRIAMRDGIFFIVNGNAGKILSFSSFGDLLSMIYNPETNPEPQLLTKVNSFELAPGGTVRGRLAATYPFNAPGEIAVDSSRRIYVEDKLPQERRYYDAESSSLLEQVILRFSPTGQYLDYLGQEGVGGTPFPFIRRLLVTDNDECVVISQAAAGWLVHWFHVDGTLRFSVDLPRTRIPLPEDGEGLIASLDDVIPLTDGSGLFLKIDYYQEIIDPETRAASGIRFFRTIVWKMDNTSGNYIDRFDIIPFESEHAKRRNETPVLRSWDLSGNAGNWLYFNAIDEDGATYYAVYDLSNRSIRRFALRIEEDELNYMDFYLTRDNILCALLASRHEARIIWWRFDKQLGGLN